MNPTMDSIILILAKGVIITFLAALASLLAYWAINWAWQVKRSVIAWSAFQESVQYFKKHNPERWAEIRSQLGKDNG